jgi:hypothetical protein
MPNQMATLDNVQTMSSKEISVLTGKRHDNVLRDTRNMLQELDLPINSKMSYKEYQILEDDKGRIAEILLNKELTLTLVSGYNVKMRHAIIKRWQELETQQPKSKYNLAFRERAFLNRGQIKPGYFSIIDVVSEKIIAPMEQFRTDFPEKFCPDISVGIFWANYLRITGRDPKSVGAIKYKHRYLDGRVVSAYQYPNTIYAEFDEWLRSEWIAKQMQRYFDGKDETLMLTAIKASKESWLTMITH